MEKVEKDKKDSSKINGNESDDEKKIPIIQTLKPKKRLTKEDKEFIKAFKAAMDVLARQKNAKV